MRLIVFFLLIVPFCASAQEALQATVDNGKAYIPVAVTNGETLFGLSRQYSIEAKDLAAFNNTDLKTNLKKDQVVKIPITNSNFSATACSNCGKVYYKVQPHEGIYRIGVNFANVGMTAIKKLNNLPTENVSIDQNILVGYLKGANNTVSYKNNSGNEVPVTAKAEPIKTVPQPEIEVPKVVEKPKETKPVEVVKKIDTPPAVEIAKPKIIEEKQPAPITYTATKSEEIKSTFASSYTGATNTSINGTAAIFKTTSGWADGKYYVLMNNAAPGTIIKVTAANGKSLFAKVLGELDSIKENANLLMRISNAAAAALGSPEQNFEVSVSY